MGRLHIHLQEWLIFMLNCREIYRSSHGSYGKRFGSKFTKLSPRKLGYSLVRKIRAISFVASKQNIVQCFNQYYPVLHPQFLWIVYCTSGKFPSTLVTLEREIYPKTREISLIWHEYTRHLAITHYLNLFLSALHEIENNFQFQRNWIAGLDIHHFVYSKQWNRCYKMWWKTPQNWSLFSAKGPWNKSLNFIFPTKYGIPKSLKVTLPETNITHENPIFLGKYHQNGGFLWAMLVSGRVAIGWVRFRKPLSFLDPVDLGIMIMFHQLRKFWKVCSLWKDSPMLRYFFLEVTSHVIVS